MESDGEISRFEIDAIDRRVELQSRSDRRNFSFSFLFLIIIYCLDKESLFLWNELENCLSLAMSYAKNDIQLQLSLVPLRSEILELRR